MLNRDDTAKMVTENILPFWVKMADWENGGFYGEADFFGEIKKTADKGCILNSRILWTFSAAYRIFKNDEYLKLAAHAREFLSSTFLDKEHGGLFWLVDYKGNPVSTRKQFYNIAFGIYALSEYFLATGDRDSLDLAMTLFESMERYGRDTVNGGYIEARAFDWSDIDDFRLSEKEINCPKSMNTNLHVLEAYTTLTHACRSQAGENDHVRQALIELTKITLEKIVNSEWRFELFFEMDWKSLSHISNGYEISYGHDIEGSWLLYEAALATNDKEIIAETKQAALSIAEAVLASAIDHKNGGLFGSCNAAGIIHDKKDWWSQAEAVVGFYNAYELSGKQTFLDTAASIWEYIKNNFTDYSNGEWHSELNPDNTPDKTMPKAGFWKCPYHNSRACFEMIRRGNR